MAHSTHRHRTVRGIELTGQAVGFVVAALAVAILVGLAILSWLEHMS